MVVSTYSGVSDAFTVDYANFNAPALFQAASPYLVAQHADGSSVSPLSPAKPSEVIIFWGTGFERTISGLVVTNPSPLSDTVTGSIGGQPATVDFAGVVGAGLVQINVHVPDKISTGDTNVIFTIGGVSTQTTNNLISIQN